MALVSSDPGGDNGALGVITLEDVIEELIGEVLLCCCIILYLMNIDSSTPSFFFLGNY